MKRILVAGALLFLAAYAWTAGRVSRSPIVQVVTDVTPKLGGDLNGQDNAVTNISSLTVNGSVTAGTFIGDGSALTGIVDVSTVTTAAPNKGDGSVGDPVTLDSASNITISTLTVTGNAFSVGTTTLTVVSGQVGIGTTAPESKFHLEDGIIRVQVDDGSTNAGLTARGFVAGAGQPPGSFYRKARGTALSSAAVQSGDQLAIPYNVRGMDDTLSFGNSVLDVTVKAAENFTSTSKGVTWEIRTASLGTTFIESRIKIGAEGNIGIGVTSPSEQLDVAKNANIDGSLVVRSSVTASTFNAVGSAYQINGVAFIDSNFNLSVASITSTGDHTMTGQLTLSGSTLTVTGNAFSVGGSTLTVSDGNVGIGTTEPEAKLQILEASGDILVVSSGTTPSQKLWIFAADGDLTPGTFGQQNIGSANAPLDKIFLSESSIEFVDTSGVVTSSLSISSPGDLQFDGNPLLSADGKLVTQDLFVDSSGNVGLGTTIPSENLDVAQNSVVGGSMTASAFFGDGAAVTNVAANTASALTSDPTDCPADQFAVTIAASGDLTCEAVIDADVPDSITIDLAAAATALAANGGNCAVGSGAGGVNASGAAEDCTDYISTGGGETIIGSLTLSGGGGNLISGASVTASGLFADEMTISTGSSLSFMLRGSVVNDPANISGSSSIDITLSAAGLNVGDICHVQAATLEADLGLTSLGVNPNDTLNVRIANSDNMSNDPASQTFDFVCWRFE